MWEAIKNDDEVAFYEAMVELVGTVASFTEVSMAAESGAITIVEDTSDKG